MKIALTILFSLAATLSAAVLKGKIIDEQSGNGIYGVLIMAEGSDAFGLSDIDGNYVIEDIPAGTYSFTFEASDYVTATIDITLTADQQEDLSLSMKVKPKDDKEVKRLQSTSVKATRLSGSDADLLSKRRGSPVVQDAIGSEQISKSPDSDASDAAKRVTGVTIVGGKNVFIRGLGERYSGVQFANSPIPSPDPDKRVVPLDIFPVSLLDNLTIIKTYNPDMPGEFGGGIVRINPKDYPDERFLTLSLGTGYAMGTTGDNFYTYKGGKYDWLGFDDGTRAMPEGINNLAINSVYYEYSEVEAIGKDFKNIYTPETNDGQLPAKFNLSYGDTASVGSGRLGYIFSLGHSLSYDTKSSTYQQKSATFETREDLTIDKSTVNTSSGALASLTYGNNNSKYKLSSFYSAQSENSTQIINGIFIGDTANYIIDYKLQFVRTSLFFNQFSGEHVFEKLNNTKLSYVGTLSLADRVEPDTRRSQLWQNIEDDTNFYLENSENVKRNFQENDEYIMSFEPSLEIPFTQWTGQKGKAIIGTSYLFRERKVQSRTFTWGSITPGSQEVTDIPLEEIFDEDNIVGGVAEAGSDPLKFYVREETSQNDKYEANLLNFASFFQLDLPLLRRVRFSGGLRAEYTEMELYAPTSTSLGVELTDINPLDEWNLLPGLNFTFILGSKFNIRLSSSKTIARPDFREALEFKYALQQSTTLVKGNNDITETDIYNADLRFEFFPSSSEIVALSFFYKYLEKPIELLEVNSLETLYIFQNAVDAENMGLEFEARKNFGFLSKNLESLAYGMNLAWIYSRINVEDTPLAAYTSKERALQGQSPYVVNLNLGYEQEKIGTSLTVLYNVFGPRIVRVGTKFGSGENAVDRGDVYEQPFHRLDLTLKQKTSEKSSLKISYKNILAQEKVVTQELQKSGTDIYEVFEISTEKTESSFSLSYSLSF